MDHVFLSHPTVLDDPVADPGRYFAEHPLDDAHDPHADQVLIQHTGAGQSGIEDPYFRPQCAYTEFLRADAPESFQKGEKRVPVNACLIAFPVLLPDIAHDFHTQPRVGDLGGQCGHRTAEEDNREVELDLGFEEVFARKTSVLQIREVRVKTVGRLIENALDGLMEHQVDSVGSV